MKPSEELRELRKEVAALREQVARANPRASPEPSAAVAPAAVPTRTKKVQLGSADVLRLIRDLEEVNDHLDKGDPEAAQDELDGVIAGLEESSKENGEDED